MRGPQRTIAHRHWITKQARPRSIRLLVVVDVARRVLMGDVLDREFVGVFTLRRIETDMIAVDADIRRFCTELGLDVRGLMGVGAPGTPEDARPGFRLLDDLAAELGLEERSMGMSSDLEVAVEEGATLVRVGTALVGPRS